MADLSESERSIESCLSYRRVELGPHFGVENLILTERQRGESLDGGQVRSRCLTQPSTIGTS